MHTEYFRRRMELLVGRLKPGERVLAPGTAFEPGDRLRFDLSMVIGGPGCAVAVTERRVLWVGRDDQRWIRPASRHRPLGVQRISPAHTSVDRGHGRFPYAAQVLVIQRHTTNLGGRAMRTEVCYAITSLDSHRAGPARLDRLARGQWQIETACTGSATWSSMRTTARSAKATARR
jgi:hypothetical protein